MPEFRREPALHRVKKVLAWVGVILAGALLVFIFGVLLLIIMPWQVAIITAAMFGVLIWGSWGSDFLKTRH